MAVTTTTRTGVTRWSSGSDAFNRAQMDDSHAALETNAAIYAQDVIGSRPTAGKVGRFYWATDETKLYYDNGVSWTTVGTGVFLPMSGGTLTGALTAATSYTVTGGSVLAATSLTAGSSTGSASLVAGATTHTFDLGRRDGSSSSPVINFHSSGNDIGYDSRIVASGGSGSVGQGILTLTAAGGITLSTTTFTVSNTDIVLGSSAGTKIGTATSQKLAFYNSTPITQPSGSILTALSNLGLVASPTLASTALSDTANIARLDAANTFTGGATFNTSGVTITDVNIALGTTTGTKLGTATSQKLGFFNATPIVQPSGNIKTALTNLGLVATPTIAAADVTGTALVTADLLSDQFVLSARFFGA